VVQKKSEATDTEKPNFLANLKSTQSTRPTEEQHEQSEFAAIILKKTTSINPNSLRSTPTENPVTPIKGETLQNKDNEK